MGIDKTSTPGKARHGARDYRSHRYAFRSNEEENRKFERMFEESGARSKTKFIVSRLFGWEFVVRKQSPGEQIFYQKLSGILRQFQGVANNYNQTVKAIHTNFGEKRAEYLLRQLEIKTGEMAIQMKEIIGICREASRRFAEEDKKEE